MVVRQARSETQSERLTGTAEVESEAARFSAKTKAGTQAGGGYAWDLRAGRPRGRSPPNQAGPGRILMLPLQARTGVGVAYEQYAGKSGPRTLTRSSRFIIIIRWNLTWTIALSETIYGRFKFRRRDSYREALSRCEERAHSR